jgi:hypothetical protein
MGFEYSFFLFSFSNRTCRYTQKTKWFLSCAFTHKTNNWTPLHICNSHRHIKGPCSIFTILHPLVEMFSINFIQLMDSKILVSEISGRLGSMHSSHGIKSIIVKKEQNLFNSLCTVDSHFNLFSFISGFLLKCSITKVLYI